MSRIGRKPINIEGGVSVAMDGRKVTVSGTKGKLDFELPETVRLQVDEESLQVENLASDRDKKSRALFGTVRSLVQNMVTGVSKGFRRDLELRGVGYRCQCKGQRLVLSLGFSHQVEFIAPDGINISIPEANKIAIEGIDKQLVGYVASKIRSFRPPDSYKGKGVRYVGENVIIKEGKTVG